MNFWPLTFLAIFKNHSYIFEVRNCVSRRSWHWIKVKFIYWSAMQQKNIAPNVLLYVYNAVLHLFPSPFNSSKRIIKIFWYAYLSVVGRRINNSFIIIFYHKKISVQWNHQLNTVVNGNIEFSSCEHCEYHSSNVLVTTVIEARKNKTFTIQTKKSVFSFSLTIEWLAFENTFSWYNNSSRDLQVENGSLRCSLTLFFFF